MPEAVLWPVSVEDVAEPVPAVSVEAEPLAVAPGVVALPLAVPVSVEADPLAVVSDGAVVPEGVPVEALDVPEALVSVDDGAAAPG